MSSITRLRVPTAMAQYDVDEPSVKRRRTQTGDAAGYSALGSASSHVASEASGLPNTRARVKNHWPEIVRALIVNVRVCVSQESFYRYICVERARGIASGSQAFWTVR